MPGFLGNLLPLCCNRPPRRSTCGPSCCPLSCTRGPPGEDNSDNDSNGGGGGGGGGRDNGAGGVGSVVLVVMIIVNGGGGFFPIGLHGKRHWSRLVEAERRMERKQQEKIFVKGCYPHRHHHVVCVVINHNETIQP